LVKNAVRDPHWVVAHVEEDDVCAENVRGPSRLFFSSRFHLLQRHSRFPPKLGGFAPLAEREAHHSDLPAALRIEGDGPSCPPDEIRGMRTDHHGGSLAGHNRHLGIVVYRKPLTPTGS